MAAACLPSDASNEGSVEDRLLTQLPREADFNHDLGASYPSELPSACPVWLDGASAAAPQSAPPPALQSNPRPKRGMEASPFAGMMSKKPFRRRAFEPIKEEEEQQAPDTSPDLQADNINTDNLMMRLPSVPNVVTTDAFMQLDGQHDLQLYLWSTLNPRIVTTGIPRPSSAGDLAERSASPGLSSSAEAEDSCSSSRTRQTRTNAAKPAPVPHKKTCKNLLLDEVFLVRRDPQRRVPDEVFHTRGPFQAGTALSLPNWAGDIWRFDLCCKISNGTEEIIWIKSLDRQLQ